MKKQVLIPTHINVDVADEYLKDGACRGIWNCNNGNDEEGLNGNLVSVKGNTKITLTTVSVNDKCLGAFADEKNNFIYVWVYNPSNLHYIYRIDILTNAIQFIVWACPDLEHTLTTEIKGVYIVDDNLLYWSDGGYAKKLNLIKAYNTTNAIPAQPYNMYYHSGINKAVLSRAKYVPNKAAVVSYGQDSTVKANLLRGKLFQHSYRWVFDDNEKTTIAPISKVALPQGDELSDGTFVTDTTVNNYQNVVVNTGHDTVRTIELLTRELNTGVIYLIDRIQKYDADGNQLIASNIDYSYSFYNNKAAEVVDQVDIVRLLNNVPLRNGTDSLIEGNRSVMGDVTVGFDNIDLDVTVIPSRQALSKLGVAPSITNFTIIPTLGSNIVRSIIYEPNTPPGYLYVIALPERSDLIGGSVITITFKFSVYIKNYSISIIESDLLLSEPAFNLLIANRFKAVYDTDPIILGSITLTSSVTSIDSQSVIALSGNVAISTGLLTGNYTNAASNYKYKSIKGGQWIGVGIEYIEDAGRRTAVQADDSMRVYVPHVTEWPTPSTLAESNYLVYSINHLAPSWATKWRLLMYTNVGYNLRIHIESIAHTGNYIEIDVNTSITNMISVNNKVNIGAYVWQKGDRIRFVARQSGANVFTPMPYLDYEIEKQDSTSGHIFVPYFDYTYYQLGVYSLVEIYRPTKSFENKIYLETSETFDVLAGGYHDCFAQVQTASQPAIGYINQLLTATTQAHEANNNFVRMRYTGIAGVNYVVEDDNYSDYYDSNAHDVGLPNVINIDAKQRRLETGLIYSGKYFEYTKINHLSTIDDNLVVLPRNKGAITDLVLVGGTLKVFCEKDIVSVYLGSTEKLDSDGNRTLIMTDSILGNQRSSDDDFGCKDAGSIRKYDRHAYFFDRVHSRMGKDSANGTIDISNGISSLLHTISESMNNDPYSYCVSAYDDLYDRYIIQFNWNYVVGLNYTLKSLTLTYSEKQKVWKEFLDWDILGNIAGVVNRGMNVMCSINQKLYAFIGNEAYEQYTNSKYNFIFGQQKTMKVSHVLNQDPHKNKIALNIAIETDNNKYIPATPDKNWSASSINVEKSGYDSTGMNTYINAIKFIMKEGILYSEIGKDINTPMAGSSNFKLLNGRPIRGRFINFTIENKADYKVILKSLIAGYIFSERSGQ